MKNALLLLVSILTIGVSSSVTSQTSRVLKQRLDSTINYFGNTQEPVTKYTFQYDQYGYPSMYSRHNWNSINQNWKGDSKYITIYDSYKNLLSKETHRWSVSNNKWKKEVKNTYIYTASHMVSSTSLFSFGFTSKQWEKVSQTDLWYNQDSTVSKEIYSKWDENTTDLEGKIKYLYSYNSNGVITQKETYRWDDSLSIWNLQSVYTYDYNSQGQKTKEESVTYLIGTPNWVGKYRNIFSYDGLGGLLEVTEYSGLNQLNVWYQNKKTQYVNDANNNHLETITSEYDTVQNVWNLNEKTESQYNSSNLETLHILYAWVNNTWIAILKNENYFNSLDQQTSETWWKYDRTLQIWKGKSKSEKSYYALNVVDTIWNYRWDLTSQTWFKTHLDYTLLDNFNNPVERTFLGYDTATATWTPTKLLTKDFNTNYPKSDLLIPPSYRDNFQLDSTLFYTWNTVTDAWNTESIRVNYFSTFNLTSVSEILENDVLIYPNPTYNTVFFKKSTSNITQIEMFDLQGKLVLKTQLSNQNSVSLSDLPSGVYIYTITTDNQVFSGKIIKR